MPKQIIDMLGNVDDFETFIDVFQMREQMTNFTAENHKMRNNDGMYEINTTSLSLI